MSQRPKTIRRHAGNPDLPPDAPLTEDEAEAAEDAVPETAEPAPTPAPAAPPPPAPAPSASSPSVDTDGLEAIARMDSSDFEAIMSRVATAGRHAPGDRVTGTIVRLDDDHAFVDLGGKSEARIAREELQPEEAQVGIAIEARVLQEREDGLLLSRSVRGSAGMAALEAAREARIPVEGRIEERNAGGYVVNLSGTRGFCPVSQVDRFPGRDLDVFVGRTMPFRVIEVREREVVVSHRALQEEEVQANRDRFWESTRPGQVLEGVVTSVREYGAFVDLNGVEGLIHRTEMGWDPVEDPNTLLSRWDRVRVKVLEMDRRRHRVALTLRLPETSPWARIDEQFVEGEVYEGRVAKTTDFGAFVELAPGIQGLVRLGNLAWERVEHASQVVEPGQVVQVRVLGVDPKKKRLDLGIRQTTEDPLKALAERYPVGAEVVGVVQQVTGSGVTLLVDESIPAWLPAREVELPPGVMLQQRVRRGARLTARVQELDRKRRQLRVTQTGSSDNEELEARKRLEESARERGSLGTFADLLGGIRLKD